MSEQVITTIVTVFGAIVCAFLAKIQFDVRATKKDAAVARTQTQNSHKTNLRDDVTNVQEEQATLASRQARNHRASMKEIGKISKQMERLIKATEANTDDIRILHKSDTQLREDLQQQSHRPPTTT